MGGRHAPSIGHRTLAEVKQPTMNDHIGDDVVIGEVSEKCMEADHICEARMEGVKQAEVIDEDS